MNTNNPLSMRRFTGRTSRDALAQVRQTFGEDAVVLSTRPCPEGVEVLAMAPEGVAKIEQVAAVAPAIAPAAAPVARRPKAATMQGEDTPLARRIVARGERMEPTLDDSPARLASSSVEKDVQTLGMSTLTFQDYVRERMLARRRQEMAQSAAAAPLPAQAAAINPAAMPLRAAAAPARDSAAEAGARAANGEPPVLRDEIDARSLRQARRAPASALDGDDGAMMGELRSVRRLIEERFGMLTFLEKLQRDPRQACLAQKLFDAGFSPALVRKLVAALPAHAGDEIAWAASVLERNLGTGEHEAPIEDRQGVFALIGATGVGKTTSTAKIAAAFATRHGAANLGLITLDAYRVAAHEQLRAYGRILGVPVHTAHDRASLEDLLELLAGKRLVLIDTAGMAQRDARTAELLEMLSHPAIGRLLVVNAAAQGETTEDVMNAYGVSRCCGVVLSKLDEAVKLAPALDALIRHKSKVIGVANGQRVPEDWHRLSAQSLVQRALRGGGSASWKLDTAEVSLVFAATRGTTASAAAAA